MLSQTRFLLRDRKNVEYRVTLECLTYEFSNTDKMSLLELESYRLLQCHNLQELNTHTRQPVHK